MQESFSLEYLLAENWEVELQQKVLRKEDLLKAYNSSSVWGPTSGLNLDFEAFCRELGFE